MGTDRKTRNLVRSTKPHTPPAMRKMKHPKIDSHRFSPGQTIAFNGHSSHQHQASQQRNRWSVAEKLARGIKCCEVALSSGSAKIWEHKIRNAQKAHGIAKRFVHRFRLSDPDSHRITQRITHLLPLRHKQIEISSL